MRNCENVVRRRGILAALVAPGLAFMPSGATTPGRLPPSGGSSAAGPLQAALLPDAATVRALIEPRLAANGVGIVVGLIDPSGRRVAAAGRSGADGVPLTADTIFQIGSLTKTVTTLLLADMVERGEVGLDDPATRYLPAGARLRPRGRSITLRDLATHVSGLPPMPANFTLDGQPDPYEAYTMAQLWAFLASWEPEREPGERYRYSNLGVSLLGHVLAGRAGTDYETLVRTRVLHPLGMKDTAITLTPAQRRRLAPGHDRYLRPLRNGWEMRNLQASGSLRSTANDMLDFLELYLGYRNSPLAAAARRQLEEPSPEVRPAQRLGWSVSEARIVTHAGGKPGYRSALAFDRTRAAGVVVLANARTDDEPMGLALHLLTGRPLGEAPAAPTKAIIAVPPARLDAFAGRYRRSDRRILEIARRDDYLLVHVPGAGVSEFHPFGEADFFLHTGNDEVSFERDAAGVVTGLLHYGDGRPGPAIRAVRIGPV